MGVVVACGRWFFVRGFMGLWERWIWVVKFIILFTLFVILSIFSLILVI
jgi:hypothetical protein